MQGTLEEAIDAAHALLDDGRAEDALAMLDRALAVACVDPLDAAEAHGLAAVAARALGRRSLAVAHFDTAHALFDATHRVAGPRAIDALRSHASLLEDRAELELETGALDGARRSLRASIALSERASDPISVETWLALAEAALRASVLPETMEAIDRALERCADADDGAGAALALEMRGDALVALGDEDSLFPADAAYSEAVDRWRAEREHGALARCLRGRARIAERRDDALAVMRFAGEISELELDASERGEATDELRSLLVSLGRDELAGEI